MATETVPERIDTTVPPAAEYRHNLDHSPAAAVALLVALAALLLAVTFRAAPRAGAASDRISSDSISSVINEAVSFNVLKNDPKGTQLVDHTATAHGRLTINDAAGFSYLPNANFLGADSFTYRARIDDGPVETTTVTIEITGEITGVETRDDGSATDEDIPTAVSVLANDGRGPDGLPLQITVEHGPDHGSAEPQPDGTVLYTPHPNWFGTDEFAYTASDGATADTGTVRITVASVDDPPTAVDDAALIRQDGTASIDAFANDFEADGDGFALVDFSQPGYGTATWSDLDHMFIYVPHTGVWGVDQFTYSIGDRDGTATGTITVTINGAPVPQDDAVNVREAVATDINVLNNDSDPDGDVLAVESVEAPAHGTTMINPDSSIRYQPNVGFAGADSFTYAIRDDIGNTREAAVTVSVEAAGPKAISAVEDEFLVVEDSPGNTLDVLSNDHDPNGATLSISIDTTPAHGTVTLDAMQMVIYVPAPEFSGRDQFTYSIGDGVNPRSSATVTVDVQAVNDPPVALADVGSGPEDSEIVIDALANDSDIENDKLSVETVTAPLNGTASVDRHGTIAFTPNADFSGVDTFDYVVVDEQGGTATSTVTVTVNAVNDPPDAKNDRAKTEIGKAVVIEVLKNDHDPDGPQTWLTISVQPENGSASITAINTIAYLPEAGFEGFDTVEYRYSDGLELSTASVRIAVGDANTTPIAMDDEVESNSAEPVEIELLRNDEDADGDQLSTYGITDPEHGTIEIEADTVTYTPDSGFVGTDSFTYKVSDGNGGRAKATVKITINPVHDRRTDEK